LKGQTTIEFMAILLVLVAYLSVVFSLFSSAKGSLEEAVDAKLQNRISRWLVFVSARPEGTEIRLDLKPYPGRYLEITCGDTTTLESPSGSLSVPAASICPPLNVTEKKCVSLESTGGGVNIEVC